MKLLNLQHSWNCNRDLTGLQEAARSLSISETVVVT
jgi:hypothetical protein